MTINRSIIVFALYIGWFLLPNTPLIKKRSFMLFVDFGRRLGPPKTLLFIT